MLEKIINNLKETVPEAFVDERPSVPWVNNKTSIINSREILNNREFPIFPPIFIEPEVEIPDVDNQLEGEVREKGIEALAWYVPFHQSKKWGIYFRMRGVYYLSNLFRTESNLNDVNERVKRAYEVIFYHEFFHFLAEITAAHMEMSYRKPFYNNYLRFLHETEHEFFYIEEPLANAYALKRMPKRFHTRIETFFKIQPPPYSSYHKFIRDTDFLNGKRELGAIIHIQDIKEIAIQRIVTNFPDVNEPFWELLFNVTPEKLFLPDIPLYFVVEKEHPTSKIEFKTPIIHGAQIAVYPCDHPPPHMHIWIPADNRRDGRYLYPSLKPIMGAKPLSSKQRKKLKKLLRNTKIKLKKFS